MTRVRHYLHAPADQERMLDQAASGPAAGILLDLEDSVLPENKELARGRAREFLAAGRQGSRHVLVKINELGGEHWQRDVEETFDHATTYLVPKIAHPDDVRAFDAALARLEDERGASRRRLAVLVESADSVSRITEILDATDRAEILVLGQADLTVSIGCQGIVGETFTPSPVLEWCHARVIVAAAGAGIPTAVSPWARRDDPEGQVREMRRLFSLGYTAIVVSSPDAVASVEEAARPDPVEEAFARAVLEARDRARAEGLGSTSHKGWLVEGSYAHMAESLLARGEPE